MIKEVISVVGVRGSRKSETVAKLTLSVKDSKVVFIDGSNALLPYKINYNDIEGEYLLFLAKAEYYLRTILNSKNLDEQPPYTVIIEDLLPQSYGILRKAEGDALDSKIAFRYSDFTTAAARVMVSFYGNFVNQIYVLTPDFESDKYHGKDDIAFWREVNSELIQFFKLRVPNVEVVWPLEINS